MTNQQWTPPGFFYDKKGHPITGRQWAALRDDQDYFRVACTQVGSYQVSTVWLGIDHRHLGPGDPVIFETMVFSTVEEEPEWGVDLECRRYCTENQAWLGHEETVTVLRAVIQEVPISPPAADGPRLMNDDWSVDTGDPDMEVSGTWFAHEACPTAEESGGDDE